MKNPRTKINIFKLFTVAILLISLIWIVFSCKKSNDSTTPVQPTNPTGQPLVDDQKETGFIPLPPEEFAKIPEYRANLKGGRLKATTAQDLSADMPPVDLDGQLGELSCTAWATGYAIRSYLYHIEKKTRYFNGLGVENRNNEAVFSPRFVYNSTNGLANIGTFSRDAFDLMVTKGVCTWKDLPYINGQYMIPITAKDVQAANNYKLTGWGRIDPKAADFKQALKNFIQIGIPVELGVKIDINFKEKLFAYRRCNSTNSELFWKTYQEGESVKQHAMVLVGFDDSKNAFKIMNSWGKNRANCGYIWMDYSLLDPAKKIVEEAYIGFNSFTQVELYKGNLVETSAEVTNAGEWSEKSSFTSSKRNGALNFAVKNKIYLKDATLNNKGYYIPFFNVYDPGNNTWTRIDNVPAEIEDFGSTRQVFVLGEKIYLRHNGSSGGQTIPKKLYEYDVNKNTLKSNDFVDTDHSWSDAVTCSIGSKGYFGLGYAGDYSNSEKQVEIDRKFWEYDPNSNKWSAKADLPVTKNFSTAAYGVINNKLYVLVIDSGNQFGSPSNLATFEYDPQSDVWNRKSTLTDNRFVSGCSFVLNGKLYYGIGQSALNDKYSPDLYAYDPSKDKWTKVKSFPGIFPRRRAFGLSVDGRAFIGLGENPNSSGTIEYYQDWWEYKP